MAKQTWSDVLGNNITAAETLAMAGNADLPAWIEAQAIELWGVEECADLDYRALAEDLRRDAGVTTMAKQFGYYEDNGGGLYVFIFDEAGSVIAGVGNLEGAQPGEWLSVSAGMAADPLAEVSGWDGQLDNPQQVYDDLTATEFGWKLVASEKDIYPDRMGAAAWRYFAVKELAKRRVDGDETLRGFRYLLIEYDWTNDREHWGWVATAPTAELIGWAQTVE